MATKKKLGRPRVREITTTQQRALDVIRAFFAQHNMSPSFTEIAAALKVSAPAARYLVQELRKKRALTFRKGVSRSITLLT